MNNKILIVDDDALIRELLKDSLAGEGYQILEAADGSEALVQAELDPPDLIIMDIVMPRMDGITTCKLIRETGWGHLIPIVMLTVLEDDESIRHAEMAGATDILLKPLQAGLLKHRIRFLIKSNKTFAQTSLSANQLSELIEGFPSPLIIYGSDLRIVWANRRAQDYFNLPLDKVIGRKCSSFCLDAQKGKCDACLFELSFRKQQPLEGVNRMGDGKLWREKTFLLRGDSGSGQKIVKICQETDESVAMADFDSCAMSPDIPEHASR